jgi:acyl carrier protein
MTSKSNIISDLRPFISAVLEISPEEVSEAIQLQGNPKWDSLAQLEIVLAAEELFNIHFPIPHLGKIENLADLIEVIHGEVS